MSAIPSGGSFFTNFGTNLGGGLGSGLASGLVSSAFGGVLGGGGSAPIQQGDNTLIGGNKAGVFSSRFLEILAIQRPGYLVAIAGAAILGMVMFLVLVTKPSNGGRRGK